jgi:DHA3 family macrolide efflux protein-like MFS transporter
VLAAGFALLAAAPALPLAMAGTALAAVGGPMGDIPVLTLIQLEIPAALLGKAFSVRATLSGAGAVGGTLLGVPLLGALGPRVGIGLAAAIGAVGACGLTATALRTPAAS